MSLLSVLQLINFVYFPLQTFALKKGFDELETKVKSQNKIGNRKINQSIVSVFANSSTKIRMMVLNQNFQFFTWNKTTGAAFLRSFF